MYIAEIVARALIAVLKIDFGVEVSFFLKIQSLYFGRIAFLF